MSFLTCFWLLPQKEHFRRSPLSPIRATCCPPPQNGPREVGPCVRLVLPAPAAPLAPPRLSSRRIRRGSGARRPYPPPPTGRANDSPAPAATPHPSPPLRLPLERYGSSVRHAPPRPVPVSPQAGS